jgi:rhombotail lipoprotein
MRFFVALASAAILSGCASKWGNERKQNASVVDYLYPKEADVKAMTPESTVRLKLPLRVGLAFVPGHYGPANDMPEAERQQLLERVKVAFADQKYIAAIEVIPTTYLRPRGGFANLEQAARMFNVDVVTLLSVDQVQFNDANRLSVLYWTIIGAYVINGDEYDTHTMVDASVFDLRSRKLLLRAPGTSQVRGSAAMVNFSEKAREARRQGYSEAIDQLIPALRAELDKFKERVKTDTSVQVTHSPGYTGGHSGGGDFGFPLVVAFAGVLGIGLARTVRGRSGQ